MSEGLVAAASATSALVAVGHSLREAFFMVWQTLWALVGGFALSGALQAFCSKATLRRHLGDRRPASLARAGLFGAASSSCSYAASAMARSLFRGGADFLTSMVFMVASTNLVIELGVVLLVLLGWPFLAAQAIGGVIMIVLLSIAGLAFLRGEAVEKARRKAAGPVEQMGSEPGEEGDRPIEQMKSLSGWSDAAGYMVSDLRMLRRELLIGFLAAGFVAVLVPPVVWSDLFVTGHGSLTSLENAAVGPLVAILSFVCSVGNVPLAAALWHGGVSFGGVVSFVFADLITLPLLLVYRKQYGGAMALRLLAVFWPVMSLAGLAAQAIFSLAGWIPSTRPKLAAGDSLHLGVTSALDIAALLLLAAAYLLSRRKRDPSSQARYATDPVCGMQVEKATAPASVAVAQETVYFCSERCRDRFTAKSRETAPQAVDPICGMRVAEDRAAAQRRRDGREYHFCSSGCAETFDEMPSDP